MSVTEYTTDDLICVCISRQVRDGEMLAQGIATPLVAAGFLLAQRTHAPHVYFASAIGNVLCREAPPLSLTRTDALWMERALFTMGFGEIACEVLPSTLPTEFFRPAQVDPQGNFNNVVIGDYQHPRLRLPGSGGIADLSGFHPRQYLYVPRHSPALFVEKLDFVSGLGVCSAESPGTRPGPRLLISDLGVFDFQTGRMRLVSYHPGVDVAKIQKKTGFPLQVARDVCETAPPDLEEVRLLRQEIDPLGIRELERMGGSRRRRRMREIVEAESASSHSVVEV